MSSSISTLLYVYRDHIKYSYAQDVHLDFHTAPQLLKKKTKKPPKPKLYVILNNRIWVLCHFDKLLTSRVSLTAEDVELKKEQEANLLVAKGV